MTTMTESEVIKGLLARVAELEKRMPLARPLRTMTLEVRLFAGVEVRDAAVELCQLADRVNTLCEADFNGVKLWARPGDNPLRLVDAWEEQMKRPASIHRIAQAS